MKVFGVIWRMVNIFISNLTFVRPYLNFKDIIEILENIFMWNIGNKSKVDFATLSH